MKSRTTRDGIAWGAFAIWILFVFWFYMQQFEPIIGPFVHALRQRLGLP